MTKNQPEYIVADGVSNHGECGAALKKKFEVFQTAPWTGEDTFGKIQFFKGNDNAKHGKIVVTDHVYDSWKRQ